MRLVVLLVVYSACHVTGTFTCETDDQCRRGPAAGVCLGGACALDDQACTSGLRFDGADCVAFVPAHVGTGGTVTTGTLALGDAAIDTTTLTFSGGELPGVVFDAWPQDDGPELAVLHAETFSIAANAFVRVTGTRPLVIVARTITIDGVIDVGAHGTESGAGTSAGTGAGHDGAHQSALTDSGAGGGGYGEAGANGGDAMCPSACLAVGGAGGSATGDPQLASLLPGFAGGASSVACGLVAGGAGGGALQLSAVLEVRVGATGQLLAGGGGGRGGTQGVICNWGAGGGGGSGGAIMFEAPHVAIAGVLAANGGAGGSGTGGASPGTPGHPGEDGHASQLVAQPGASVGVQSGKGGAGGALQIAPEAGADQLAGAMGGDNGGGGGGGVGRIVIAATVLDSTPSTISPAPVVITR